MPSSAMRFVGPPSFQGVTGNPVLTGLWSADGSPEPHVTLGDWAQLILRPPAPATIGGRVAGGRSDDIVTATLLASRCLIVVAPAMNDAMWSKRAVQENIAALRRRGVVVVEPESGHLASGHVGAGRLANASALMKAMADAVRSTYDLAGRRVVVTAGGTREPVDLVRYVSNYSSGKMGFAMAAAATEHSPQEFIDDRSPGSCGNHLSEKAMGFGRQTQRGCVAVRGGVERRLAANDQARMGRLYPDSRAPPPQVSVLHRKFLASSRPRRPGADSPHGILRFRGGPERGAEAGVPSCPPSVTHLPPPPPPVLLLSSPPPP